MKEKKKPKFWVSLVIDSLTRQQLLFLVRIELVIKLFDCPWFSNGRQSPKRRVYVGKKGVYENRNG